MKRVLILAAVAVLTVGLIGTVSANDDRNDDQSERRDVKASLGGFAEVPSISTTGTGRLRLRINPETSTITYELTYSGLQGGAVVGAHLHLGQVGVAGLVIANLCGGTEAACPATAAGVLTGTIVPAEILGPAAQGIAPGEFTEVLRAIRAGAVYANVHTTAYPAGEIRGQVRGGNS
jgi:hypothetical protein